MAKALRVRVLLVIVLVAGLQSTVAGRAAEISTVQELGQALFFDTDLSMNRTQACATCHSPDLGFTDPRETVAGRAVSLGDDGYSIGIRNAPTTGYASFSPPFGKSAEGKWRGGQFLDGREADLEGQAGEPPLNPLEMGMPSKKAVVERLKEKADYVAAFERLFVTGILDETEAAYQAMTRAIAAFERTHFFSPFDSKYDRYLRGEDRFTDQEELGRLLFFSSQFTNCSQCHRLNSQVGAAKETFSNYEFHNIGVPENPTLSAVSGATPGNADMGLFANPAVKQDQAQKGKFKTPTLRNVAITGPYMHNGVFNDLRTVVLFYNKYNSKAPARQIDPETGKPWAAPEVLENLSLKELESGPALNDMRIDALVAFLTTLTDRRYEHLLGK